MLKLSKQLFIRKVDKLHEIDDYEGTSDSYKDG